jgi:isopentenyl-diphosphate Delta-isomerase
MDDGLEQIVLVDAGDNEIGTAGKLEGHRHGLLHRALSVIVQDGAGRLLLQKRQHGKYHSGGLWTNTCCSHPRPGEPVAQAAERRLAEEMGFSCLLRPLLTVTYRADVGGGLIEHELVHVFGGRYEGPVRPDPREADGFAWVDPEALLADMALVPARYSVWFRKYCAEHWHEMRADAA